MNYIFFYKGDIKKHIYESINSILSVDKSAYVYFCSDKIIKSSSSRFNLIDIKDIQSDLVNEIDKIEKFEQLDNNPLWETSLLRVFYLYEVAKVLGIEKFVHFDNDVVLYEPYENLKDNFDDSKINITRLTNDMLIFGYCFIGNIEVYKNVCESLIEIYQNKSAYEQKYFSGKSMVEMRSLHVSYLKNPEYFNILNSIPNANSSFVFDPLSFGQFLGGRHYKRFSKGYLDKLHLTYELMKNNELKPKYKNGIASVSYKGINNNLANLHVHSKKLSKFKPISYENYFQSAK